MTDTHPPRSVLGEALRRLRTDRRLLQRDVAARAGINRPMLSAYESGKVEPKFDGLVRVLEAMGANLGYLGTYMELVTRGRRLGKGVPDPPPWSESQARSHLHAALDHWADALVAEIRASLETAEPPTLDTEGAKE